MDPTTAINEQIEQYLTDIGAFRATCPGCGKIFAFETAPRVPGPITPEPGHHHTLAVSLPCTRCSYIASYDVEVTWPVLTLAARTTHQRPSAVLASVA